jgi:hypothetical protein
MITVSRSTQRTSFLRLTFLNSNLSRWCTSTSRTCLTSHKSSLTPARAHRARFSVGIRLYQSVETDASKTLELGFMQYVRGYQAASMAQIRTLSSLLPSVMELEIRSDDYFSTLDDKPEELEDVRDKF